MMETIMTRMKLQLAKALPVRGQITTMGQVAQGAHQKREPLTIENWEEAKRRMHSKKRRYSSTSSSSASESCAHGT